LLYMYLNIHTSSPLQDEEYVILFVVPMGPAMHADTLSKSNV